jgi:hypothetical protein
VVSTQKLEAAARVIEGKVVRDDLPLQVFIRGTVFGFPAMLQAIVASWPFGVTYIVETKVVDDPNQPPDQNQLSMTIIPRSAKGPFRSITRFLFMEQSGLRIGDQRMQDRFVITANNSEEGDRFLNYPGVYEALLKLEKMTKFNEVGVRTNAGLSLSQSKSFNALDLDVMKETFRVLGELGQIVFESFS